jgi:predicted kinase
MTNAVIFDIDGTLANCSHRLHHVTAGSKNWDAFFAGAKDDLPHREIVDLAQILHAAGKTILLVSGRPEKIRVDTEQWMTEQDVHYERLYMRPDGDHRADTLVKSQILDGILADGYEIDFVVDDRPTVVQVWRERGLVCLQCRDWNERKPKAKGLLTIMVGPSGAGKTTWLQSEEAQSLGIHRSHVIASDQLRQDLCGDFRDQSRNEDVFAALHAVAKARIAHGLPCVVDATNIKRADRLGCVALADGGEIRYVVMDRPMAEKVRDAGWRAAVSTKGKPLIEHHAQVFESQIADILKGDSQPNVTMVADMRRTA